MLATNVLGAIMDNHMVRLPTISFTGASEDLGSI